MAVTLMAWVASFDTVCPKNCKYRIKGDDCLHYVPCSKALMDLVLAEPGFLGKCPGQMCGKEWRWWWRAGKGAVDCPVKGAAFENLEECAPEKVWDNFLFSESKQCLLPCLVPAGLDAAPPTQRHHNPLKLCLFLGNTPTHSMPTVVSIRSVEFMPISFSSSKPG